MAGQQNAQSLGRGEADSEQRGPSGGMKLRPGESTAHGYSPGSALLGQVDTLVEDEFDLDIRLGQSGGLGLVGLPGRIAPGVRPYRMDYGEADESQAPTCYNTCGNTCGNTCADTCSTCRGYTCETCDYTCANTCGNTCRGYTCETCSYTCGNTCGNTCGDTCKVTCGNTCFTCATQCATRCDTCPETQCFTCKCPK